MTSEKSFHFSIVFQCFKEILKLGRISENFRSEISSSMTLLSLVRFKQHIFGGRRNVPEACLIKEISSRLKLVMDYVYQNCPRRKAEFKVKMV